MKYCSCIILAFALTAGWTLRSSAQSLSSPESAPSAEKRPDFSGTWTLDRSVSNDPAQANFGAGQASQGQERNRRRGGFGGFGGRGGYGGGGYGGSGSRDTTNGNSTPDERARLAALADQLKKASSTLIISHHDPSFVINDAQDHTLFFQTNASRDDHTLGEVMITSSTHWQDDRIVTEYAVSSRRTLVYTYRLLANTKQLVLRVRPQFNDAPGANATELKLVYSLTSQGN